MLSLGFCVWELFSWNVCQGWFEESRQAQAGMRPLRHKADRLVTCALKLCSVVVRR